MIDVHMFGLSVKVEVSYQMWSGAWGPLAEAEWLRVFGSARSDAMLRRQSSDMTNGVTAYWYGTSEPNVFNVLVMKPNNRATISVVHVTYHEGKNA